MANRSFLTGLYSGINQGFTTSRAQEEKGLANQITKMIYEAQIKNQFDPKEYKATTREEFITNQKEIHPERFIFENNAGTPSDNTTVAQIKRPPITEEEAFARLPKDEMKEDWQAIPVTKSMKGMAFEAFDLKRKDKVPPKQLGELKDLESNMYELDRNLKTLQNSPEIKQFIGPGIATRPGPIADIITQLGGAPEGFATFKAEVDKAFQKYRKWVTGVQAGYPELQWLVVDFPKPTDKADIFISKTLSANESMKTNREMFINYLSDNNYAVGKIKKRGIVTEQAVGDFVGGGNNDLSSLSDEELRKIAGGGK